MSRRTKGDASSRPPHPDRVVIGRTQAGGARVIVIGLPSASAPLTDAESEVVSLALAGHTNAEIASLRGVSARTIANQLASAYDKLGVSGRAELAARLAGG